MKTTKKSVKLPEAQKGSVVPFPKPAHTTTARIYGDSLNPFAESGDTIFIRTQFNREEITPKTLVLLRAKGEKIMVGYVEYFKKGARVSYPNPARYCDSFQHDEIEIVGVCYGSEARDN